MFANPLSTSEGNLVNMANAIGDLRALGDSSSPSMTVNLPDGRSILGQSGVENKLEGITITPKACFALKTKVVGAGLKVFINLCSHEEIDAPSVKKKLNAEGESVEGMNVPLSVGPECYDKDHAGIECLVYDIIVNPKVIQDSASDETGQYRDFLCHLSIQSVEQKYPNKGVLDRQYKLPKLQYMGVVIRSQHIRDKKTIPGIHDISETISRESNVNKIVHKTVEKIPAPIERELSFSLYWIKKGKCSDKDMKNRESVEEPSSSAAKHSWEHSMEHTEYEVSFNDTNKLYGLSYIEPIMIPDSDVLRLTLKIHFTENIDVENLDVEVSPYKFQIKVTGYKTLLVYLPCAIIPYKTSSTLNRPEGFVNRIVYGITGEIDRTPYGDICDVGSKPWLVSQAFNGPENENEYKNENENRNKNDSKKKNENENRNESECKGGGDSETGRHGISGDYPEDKFHIKLPSNVNQYTGVPKDDNDDDNNNIDDIIIDDVNDNRIGKGKEDNDYYPEDSFHQKDASSSYLISQREERIKDKWAKHEKEKLERQNDPNSNIEYVDVDDYKPGGKYGPAVKTEAAKVIGDSDSGERGGAGQRGGQGEGKRGGGGGQGQGRGEGEGGKGGEQQEGVCAREDLDRASQVLATAFKGSDMANLLSSNLWTQLLD